MNSLRLDRLTLSNFRCFAQCEVGFHPELTVLVAENGNGKTAILDAAALALSAFVHAANPAVSLQKIDRSDVRLQLHDGTMQPCLPTGFEAQGRVGDATLHWGSLVRNYRDKVRPSVVDLRPLQEAALTLRKTATVLPLVAFYGTGRLWSDPRLTEGRRTSLTDVNERLGGYVDCLASSSSFKGLSAWYGFRVEETASPTFKEGWQANVALQLAVKTAVATVLQPTGWAELDWDKEVHALTAAHVDKGRLPLAWLSDGVRTMLALVADIARRCGSLNPHLGEDAARQTPGIVLIDEIDMHLHPRWQQVVIALLQTAFPQLQIIATTHSPHVLSTVDKDSIRVIRIANGQADITTPTLQTKGVESADVLASVMGVDPIPQLPEAQQLVAYRALIEDGRSSADDALALRAQLVAHFGETHPVMLECDRLIRFQQFRLRRTTGGEG